MCIFSICADGGAEERGKKRGGKVEIFHSVSARRKKGLRFNETSSLRTKADFRRGGKKGEEEFPLN